MMEEIDQYSDDLKELKQQLKIDQDEEDDGLCPACGWRNDPGTRFCQECGNPLDQAQPGTCPSCGEVVAEGVKFCGSCGEKL